MHSGSTLPQDHRAPPQAMRAAQPLGNSSSKAGARGYRARREQLHKAKSKTAVSESNTSLSELQQSWGEAEQDQPPTGSHPSPPAPQHASTRVVPPLHSPAVIPIVRHRSVKEKGSDSPPPTANTKPRPLSAVDPHSVTAPTPSYGSTHLRPSDTSSLFKTIHTLTPSGEEEVFREVDIGEAINRSQGGVLSAQEHGTEAVGMLKAPFTRHVSAVVVSPG